jgi:heme exporter protein A
VKIEARALTARRGDATLFRGLDLSLAAGEALVVSGPNGSGKTTLLRILAGLTAPAEGEVRLADTPVRPFDPRLRDVVVFHGHFAALKDELTVLENLAAWTTLGNEAQGRDALLQALERVALRERARLPARALSQGQRRRIGIARLALSRRPLWILDEPLTALDGDGTEVLASLLAAQLQTGGAIVAASHQPLQIGGARVLTLDLGAGPLQPTHP